jgi:hypothetical protein
MSKREKEKGSSPSPPPPAPKATIHDVRLKRVEFWIVVANGTFELLRPAVWFAGLSSVSYFLVALPIYYAAGKKTDVNFFYQAIVNARLDLAASLAAAALFGGLWQRERRLKRNDVRRLHGRIKELETLLDPARTSSGLTETGDTPRDTT